MLRDWQRDAGDIDLLKGIRTQHLRRHLPCNRNHRHGVQHRRGQSRHKVRRARPGSRHAHAHAARSPRVAIGHVRGALLMPHQHMVDGRELAQRIVDRQNRATGIPKDGRRAFTG